MISIIVLLILLLVSTHAYFHKHTSRLLRSPVIVERSERISYSQLQQSSLQSNTATSKTGLRKRSILKSINTQRLASKKAVTAKKNYLNGVVKVYCTHSEPNYAMPWQRQRQEFSTSSGFAISNKRILTNAHAVEHGTMIQVKKRQSEKKYLARVEAIGHQCDLAVLHIEDDSFWSDMPDLQFGPLPNLLDEVAVIGYPVGGESMSITCGVVSRIEMQEYAQASEELLAIQIDAAINPGNSGGPVFNENKEVIGVAFQSLSEEDTENIGYVVPVNVIHHFLKSIEKELQKTKVAQYKVCSLGANIQPLESNALRKHFQLSDQQTGVLVARVNKQSPAANVLQPNDIILSMDAIEIANDGSIPFPDLKSNQERVHMSYYMTQKFEDDFVHLQVLRDGKILEVDVQLWVPDPLIPRSLLETPESGSNENSVNAFSSPPSYVMVGGLVFLKLTREYLETEFDFKHLQSFDTWVHRFKLLSKMKEMREEEEEIIVLSQILAHKCNIGYDGFEHFELSKFGGKSVKNMKQLKTEVWHALESMNTPELVFEFVNGAKVVLSSKEVLRAQRDLCREHLISCAYSENLE